MNSSSPKISIIVPNYNYAHFLDKRIESILKQTYNDYEIILLDDASTDDSVKVLEKYNLSSTYKCNFLGADNKQ